jgi:hypothetical protein
MDISRRKMLALVGGGFVVAAGGAGAAFSATRTPHRAFAPWSQAGGQQDARLKALSYALLAPNAHNLQPWRADLIGADRVRIWRDKTLDLPMTDPFARQLTIGMGCFLELMVMAAGEHGHLVDLALFPEGEDGPVAEARFLADSGHRDPLFAHVRERRSCKEPYADRPVPAADAQALARHARIITDREQVAALRALAWEAHRIEVTTPRTNRESVELMRLGRSEIEANPDGIDLGGPLMEALMLTGVMSRAALSDPASSAFQQGLEMYEKLHAATPAFAVIVTETNDRIAQIGAGRDWMRLNLATTARGLALHPVSQALQEYPEMAGPYARAHRLLTSEGGTVQMLGRLGYGPRVPPAPRWPLEARLRDA